MEDQNTEKHMMLNVWNNSIKRLNDLEVGRAISITHGQLEEYPPRKTNVVRLIAETAIKPLAIAENDEGPITKKVSVVAVSKQM